MSGREPPVTCTTAKEAATALKISALRLSPGLSIPPPVSDCLQAAHGQPPTQPSTEKKEKQLKVPDSVKQAAAAISATRGLDPSRLLAMFAAHEDSSPTMSTAAPSAAPSPPASDQAPAQRLTAADASSMLAVALPQAEFTYIERPWEHFVRRWAAIRMELHEMLPNGGDITVVDLGSCCGFFSLQTAVAFPDALVVGVEGSVGIGNGTQGVDGNEERIIATQAIQTHLRWIQNLKLSNCFVAPEVWTYSHIRKLASLGMPVCDVMLSLSVVHHIDNVSEEQYAQAGLSRVDGTLRLIAGLLDLARVHFIELPDRPWLEHMYKAFGTSRRILEEATKYSTRTWNFVGPLCQLDWYGTRYLWLLEDTADGDQILPREGLKSLFSRTMGGPESQTQAVAGSVGGSSSSSRGPAASAAVPRAVAETLVAHPAQAVPGSAVLSQPSHEDLGAILLAAPTALIAAHVHLREALSTAENAMRELEADDIKTSAGGANQSGKGASGADARAAQPAATAAQRGGC
mmetsp:Transcript_2454/g.5295  ORF Transcript_2454/g.5295 Transcript_2454/m.5295 type:complete len:517 (+) Transcript_2454:103-1653(+)